MCHNVRGFIHGLTCVLFSFSACDISKTRAKCPPRPNNINQMSPDLETSHLEHTDKCAMQPSTWARLFPNTCEKRQKRTPCALIQQHRICLHKENSLSQKHLVTTSEPSRNTVLRTKLRQILLLTHVCVSVKTEMTDSLRVTWPIKHTLHDLLAGKLICQVTPHFAPCRSLERLLLNDCRLDLYTLKIHFPSGNYVLRSMSLKKKFLCWGVKRYIDYLVTVT